MPQSRIVSILEKARSTVTHAVKDLEESGDIDVDRAQNSNFLDLTRSGWRTWKKAVGRPGSNSEDSRSDAGQVSLHNFSVRFSLRNASSLADGWRERWATGKVQRDQHDFTNDSHLYWVDNWRFRITGEHVIVRLQNEIRGDDPVNLKDRAMAEVLDARDWLENNSPARVASKPKDFRIFVNRQHLAIVHDPFCELVDQNSEVDISDIKFYDESGQERLWLDNSNGEHHLEAGNAPGENRVFSEDDIDFIKSQYEWMIDHKDEVEKLRDLAEALDHENNPISLDALRDTSSGARIDKLNHEYTITSTWLHRAGHVMGWAEELGKPVTLVRSESIES